MKRRESKGSFVPNLIGDIAIVKNYVGKVRNSIV